MLVPYGKVFSKEEIKRFDKIREIMVALEPEVTRLTTEHRRMSKRWAPHHLVPWGQGKDFEEIPWSPEQSPLSPDITLALETNLLTEDNLPYYHAQIERMVPAGSPWQEWNRLWTSEEGLHAAVLRDYLYLMRVMDPDEIEQNRLRMMETGFDRDFADPFEVFAYTSAQELATRISHLRTGQRADEPVILKILSLISRDENFHFIFYRSVVKEILAIAPELMLPAIMRQFYSFTMPGTGMNSYELREAVIANAGIYGAREHRDQVVVPLLSYWEIEKMTGLPPETSKVQERLLRIVQVLDRMVERQDRRLKKTD